MNRTKIKIAKTFLSILCAAFISCDDNPVSSLPEIPIATLLAASDTVEINDQKIFLSTYLWRDFMPASPPNSKPLIASVKLETVDSSDISDLLIPKAIYIIDGNQVWNSYFTDENFSYDPLYNITKIARDGPKWGPEIMVDVVVLFNSGRDQKLIKAANQYINRTD